MTRISIQCYRIQQQKNTQFYPNKIKYVKSKLKSMECFFCSIKFYCRSFFAMSINCICFARFLHNVSSCYRANYILRQLEILFYKKDRLILLINNKISFDILLINGY